MRRRCAHAAEQIRLAQAQVRKGRHDEALDTYLTILSRHPVGERCRAPIAQAAADLAFDLGCFTLAQRLAGAAFDETNQWPVPRRRRAAAWLTIGRTEAWLGEEEAASTLSGAELPGRWPWTLRPLARVARAELAACTDGSDTAGEPSPAEAEKRYRSLVRRMGRRTCAIRQVGYAGALLTAGQPEWAAAHFAAAAARLSRYREVRRWVKRGLTPSSQHAQQVCLAWARAVTGKLHDPADLAPHAATACLRAIDVLHRLGHHPTAARAAAHLGDKAHRAGQDETVAAAVERVAARRCDSICWYGDHTLVSQWADSVANVRRLMMAMSPETAVGDIGWLTMESGARVLNAIEMTYTALRNIDAENFEATTMLACRNLAIDIDRIGLPRLALAASEREVAILQNLVDEHGDDAREELAWALRRHAICLTDAGVTDGVAATWTEAADLHFRFGHVEAAALAHQRLTDFHVAAGDWRAAASATTLGASHVAAITGEPPLPAIDAALSEIEVRAFERNLTTTLEEFSGERLELAALMAAWDPDTYTAPYVHRLIGRANRDNLPADERAHALNSAVAAARGLAASQRSEGDELLTHALTVSATFALGHGLPSEALAHTDEVIARHRAAIAAGRSRHHDLVAALMRRERCLKALGRHDERATSLTEAYAAVREGHALGCDPQTDTADIAARLWDIEAVDLAIQVLSDAVTWNPVNDDRGRQYAQRALYLAHLRRPEEALRDLDAATQLVGDGAWLVPRRGRVLSLIGRRREAREVFDRLATLRPYDPYARRMLGLIKLDSGDPEGAVEDLLKAVRLGPASAANRIALAYAYLATGELDEALRHGHLAADLADADAEAHYVYGVALRIYGDHASGDAELALALALMVAGESPLAGDRYAYRATFEAARGRGRDAVDQLRRGTRIGLTPEMFGYVNTQLRVLETCLPDAADACTAMRAAIAA
jgi:tetratricopeptide (TPR) repeat protein